MGKYVLLLVMAAAGVWALAQQQTTLQTAETEVEREEEVLARQAARTGLNSLLAETRKLAEDKCPDQIVESVDSRSGTYETDGYHHGTYKAWLDSVDLVGGYRAHAKGQFPDQSGATVTLDRLIQRTEGREGLIYGEKGNGKLKKTTTEGSEEFGSAPEVDGAGPLATDLDGDGNREVPYVKSDTIEMVDDQGNTQELVPSSASEGVPAYEETRLATGMWKSGRKSVFYANEDHEAIYSVGWEDGSATEPQEVVSPEDDAQAVLGIDDIDGDGEMELVFADGSQHVRYVEEPGGSIEKLENGGVGSSEGIGSGGLHDLDGDGTASAVFINGSNNLRVVDADGTDRTIYLGDDSDDGAAKAPPTMIDLDGDDELEIAYLRNEDEEDGPDVEFVDQDGSDIRTLCGISVEKGVGLQSQEENGSGPNSNEWCADSETEEEVDEEEEEEEETEDGDYSYDYEYDYTYEKGRYRYEYDYDYVWSEEANQDPDPSPNPPEGQTCGAENIDPNPIPTPNPDS